MGDKCQKCSSERTERVLMCHQCAGFSALAAHAEAAPKIYVEIEQEDGEKNWEGPFKTASEAEMWLIKRSVVLTDNHARAAVVRKVIPTSGHSEPAPGLREALEFYANPETYFAIGIFPDKPCGPFIDDFSETELGNKPGKRARAALTAPVPK